MVSFFLCGLRTMCWHKIWSGLRDSTWLAMLGSYAIAFQQIPCSGLTLAYLDWNRGNAAALVHIVFYAQIIVWSSTWSRARRVEYHQNRPTSRASSCILNPTTVPLWSQRSKRDWNQSVCCERPSPLTRFCISHQDIPCSVSTRQVAASDICSVTIHISHSEQNM